MIKLAGLIPVVTAPQGLPEAAGTTVVRSLRPARLLNTGGRGPGGADMTAWDAANLLLGTTCLAQAKDAGEAVPRYRSLFGSVKQHMIDSDTDPPVSLCPEPMRWLSETAQGKTLGDALDRLIGMACTGELQNLFRDLAGKHVGAQGADRDAVIDRVIHDQGVVFLKLEFRRPRPGAVIVFGEAGAGPRLGSGPYLEVEFGHRSALETPEEMDSRQIGDRVETVTITHRTIFALGEALRS